MNSNIAVMQHYLSATKIPFDYSENAVEGFFEMDLDVPVTVSVLKDESGAKIFIPHIYECDPSKLDDILDVINTALSARSFFTIYADINGVVNLRREIMAGQRFSPAGIISLAEDACGAVYELYPLFCAAEQENPN